MNNYDERLDIIRQYKLSKREIVYFQDVLEEIKKKEIIEEVAIDGRASEPKVTSLLEKMIELQTLGIEINLSVMKNMLAIHLEHALETEITTTKMKDNLNQTLASLGFDEKSFRRMFGGKE